MQSDYLTINEIAAQLKVSWFAVKNWIETGELPASKFGKQYRVSRADYEEFLKRKRIKPPTEQ
jgi:excisionase family DNA binding protein